MKIVNVHIKKFRSIKEATIELKDLSLLIGNNATGKTTILEALNFCLSPYYLSGKIQQTDFHNATDDPIIIEIEFNDTFTIQIPDGYAKQEVVCKKIHLEIKKRQRAAPNKSFSDGFTVSHYYLPLSPKTDDDGWEQQKKGGNKFKFTDRHLSSSFAEINDGMKSFYLIKTVQYNLKEDTIRQLQIFLMNLIGASLRIYKKKMKLISKIKKNIEEQVFSKVDEKTLKKTIETLNSKLENFSIPKIGVSLFESHSPFNTAFL